MIGGSAKRRGWLGHVTARPKLCILFALLVFLAGNAVSRLLATAPRATAVVEVRASPLQDRIDALDTDLPTDPLAANGALARLSSPLEMARTVLDRLSPGEIAALAPARTALLPPFLRDQMVGLCARDGLVVTLIRPVCAAIASDGQPPLEPALLALHDAVSVTTGEVEESITVAVEADDPERAARLANLFAEALVQTLAAERQQWRRALVAWITEERAARLDRIGRYVVTTPASTSIADQDPIATATSDASLPEGGAPEPADTPWSIDDPAEAARTAREAYDGFLRQTAPILTSTAWAEPAAVIRSQATPPPPRPSPVQGLTATLLVPVSLLLGVLLGTLVDVAKPARAHRPGFHANPYWPKSGHDVVPAHGRLMISVAPAQRLIGHAGSTMPAGPSPGARRRS